MFCPQCGSQIDEDARFCPECGATLDVHDGPSAAPVGQTGTPQTPEINGAYRQNRHGPHRKAVLIAFIVLDLVLVVAVAFVLIGGSRKPNADTDDTASSASTSTQQNDDDKSASSDSASSDASASTKKETSKQDSTHKDADGSDKADTAVNDAATFQATVPVITQWQDWDAVGASGRICRASWNAVEGAEGYEVKASGRDTGEWYSDNRNNNTTTQTHWDLSSSTVDIWVLQVRAYKTVNGNRIYTAWSEQSEHYPYGSAY